MIRSIECHFLVQVKGNCPKLWETIALHTALASPISTCEYYEDKKGYQVHRRIELYVNKADLPKGWNGITRLVKVRRWGIRKGKAFEQLAFYVLSKPLNSALIVARAIQGHWGIENKLHWIKDVNFGEDDTTLTSPKGATILAYLNNVANNILKLNGLKPTKDTFAQVANKTGKLNKLLNVA